MPDTSQGLTYPDSSGHTRIWEHIQALAEDVDRELVEQSAKVKILTTNAKLQGGSFTIPAITAGTSATVNVTFPTPFANTAIAIAMTPHSGRVAPGITAITTTGFTVVVDNFSGGNSVSGTCRYLAVGP